MANVGHSVVAYTDLVTSYGIIYYYNIGSALWVVSNLITLDTGYPIRFATINGSVFETNSSDAKHDSQNGGQTWGTVNSITTSSDPVHSVLAKPALLLFSQGRLLASGWTVYPNRIYFSSLVDPSQSPFITWDTTDQTGDYLDIDSSSGIITALANTSTMTLVYTVNGMYRLNTISKTVDAENIFNVGAISQESIVNCLGLVYFYSGNAIYSTDGTFPTQISRIGVQDFVDAINVSGEGGFQGPHIFAGTDGFNVYFSIGTVTLNSGPEDYRTYKNVVLKFSPRDQNWQIFSYSSHLGQFTQFNNIASSRNLAEFQSAQYDGKLDIINSGTSDNGSAIPFSLETQELELGNRSHEKNISDKIVVYTQNGNESSFSVKANDGEFDSAQMTLESRVNVGTKNINFAGNFFTFLWKGESLGSRPIFEGFHLPKVTDLGITKNG